MKDEILEKLIQRAAEVFNVDVQTLNGQTHFKNDLKAKSANIVQITTFLEDEFDVEIPYMEFNRKPTFDEAAEYIEMLIEG
ncbi:MAG: phosphopantetheine-binding protein [Desulfobacteraceae bacterium]|jgi:acyl carrier protein